MNRSIGIAGALALVVAALIATPSAATPVWNPVTVSNVGIDPTNYGQMSVQTALDGTLYYSGGISMNIAANGSSIGTPIVNVIPSGPPRNYSAGGASIVFCDDLNNVIYIGGTYTTYFESTDSSGADNYLTNSGLTLDQSHDIAGIAMYGTFLVLNNLIDSTTGNELQLAIWQIENPGLIDNSSPFYNDVNVIISEAPGWYDDGISAGWTYLELVAPCDGISPNDVSFHSCQTQAQIIGIPGDGGPNLDLVVPVPEPVSIAVFGVGLFGTLFGYRRKTTRSAHRSR
jgi:hypothetical protein